MVSVQIGNITINTDRISEPLQFSKSRNKVAMSGRSVVHNFGIENRSWNIQGWVLTKADYATIRTFALTGNNFTFTDEEGNTHDNVSIDSLVPIKNPYGYTAFDLDISEDN